jgi:GNAT superfamily N-acetyltransferase
MSILDYRLEALAANHNRKDFACNEPELDEYLRQFARQHAKSNISRTYVAAAGSRILGYYSISMGAIQRDNLPPSRQARLPNFPLPIARLARLAVDRRVQRQRLGEILLMDALYRCYQLSQQIGMMGVVVDAKHERAKHFYQRYEFEEFPDHPLTLWLPIQVIEGLMEEC